jgi:hypothetical protein
LGEIFKSFYVFCYRKANQHVEGKISLKMILDCKFELGECPLSSGKYLCLVSSASITARNTKIKGFTGIHLPGKTNEDVELLRSPPGVILADALMYKPDKLRDLLAVKEECDRKTREVHWEFDVILQKLNSSDT